MNFNGVMSKKCKKKIYQVLFIDWNYFKRCETICDTSGVTSRKINSTIFDWAGFFSPTPGAVPSFLLPFSLEKRHYCLSRDYWFVFKLSETVYLCTTEGTTDTDRRRQRGAVCAWTHNGENSLIFQESQKLSSSLWTFPSWRRPKHRLSLPTAW